MPKTEINQEEIKRRIELGPAMGQVTQVGIWYKDGHFENDEQAKGAFELAHQQYLDGMGNSPEHWMGLTEEEFGVWHKDRDPSEKEKKLIISFKKYLKRPGQRECRPTWWCTGGTDARPGLAIFGRRLHSQTGSYPILGLRLAGRSPA